jgi:hypothetical protein
MKLHCILIQLNINLLEYSSIDSVVFFRRSTKSQEMAVASVPYFVDMILKRDEQEIIKE